MTGPGRHPDGRRTVLVTGGTGQVGHELVRELAPVAHVVAPGRAHLDLTDVDAIRAYVRALRPDAVVNAAAYTAVDRAESERPLALAVNAAAPGALAEEAARLGVPMVHYSTDYVFDGSKAGAYGEDDAPAPLGVYGETKLLGERAVAAAGGAHVTLRTSWVYGSRGRNFVMTMLALARSREELRVVDDQVGAPTWSRLIAAATAHVVGRAFAAAEGPYAWVAERRGVYHLAAAGHTSWHGFAAAALALDPQRGEQTCRAVTPISTAEYPTPARRPRNSMLDTAKLRRTFGLALPEWHSQLSLVLAGDR